MCFQGLEAVTEQDASLIITLMPREMNSDSETSVSIHNDRDTSLKEAQVMDPIISQMSKMGEGGELCKISQKEAGTIRPRLNSV